MTQAKGAVDMPRDVRVSHWQAIWKRLMSENPAERNDATGEGLAFLDDFTEWLKTGGFE